MDQIIENIRYVISNYLSEKVQYKTVSKTRPLYGKLIEEIPELFRLKANLGETYAVKGRMGSTNISEIPWVCFFDLDITHSAQSGYYIALLFRSDFSGFYLSLNQGWTQYDKRYGKDAGGTKAKARDKILENSRLAQKVLRSTLDFDTSPLNLKAHLDLGKGYELGNICSKYYASQQLPDDSNLIDDLRNLIGIYRELKGLVGQDILNISARLSEEEFQLSAQDGKGLFLPDGPIPKRPRRPKSKNEPWPRDPDIAHIALKKTNYSCERDSLHLTFTSRRTMKPFVEAHHFIPMEFQDDYTVSIDVPENIISLCPNCHSAFHYSISAERDPLVEKFHKERSEKLRSRGIDLDLSQILAMYIKR